MNWNKLKIAFAQSCIIVGIIGASLSLVLGTWHIIISGWSKLIPMLHLLGITTPFLLLGWAIFYFEMKNPVKGD